ncbi:MAG: glycosyltransferase family 2 protein [Candidatus Brocadia sp.]|nr:glycosyltransferase family 2 protein [Candidatus Brocadia sp.]
MVDNIYSSTSNPLVSIVIVNYNGKHFLADCLNSIKKYATLPHEVIIVDNASTDGSCEYLQKYFPNVNLISSTKNLGFAGGNNFGAKKATGKYLLLLNNDTVLLTNIKIAISEFEKDEQLGVLGCKLLYGNKSTQPSYGYEHTPLSLLFSWLGLSNLIKVPKLLKRVEIDEANYRIPQHDVAWVSGAFLMTKTTLWHQLGGTDERYFMYIEDVDFCRCVRDLGFRVAYIPNVEIIHYEGAGREWIGPRALEWSMRSYIIYTQKYSGIFWAWFVRIGLSIIMLLRVLAYFLITILKKSTICKEKRIGYLRAVFQLLVKGTRL